MEIDAINWKKVFFYPKGQYGLNSYFNGIKYDFSVEDYKELKTKYLDIKKLKKDIDDVFEFFTCDENDIKEWFDEEDEDEDDPEYMSKEKKFWEMIGMGKIEKDRKEFEKDMISNFINCRVFYTLKKGDKNCVKDLKKFIKEAEKDYDFELNEELKKIIL